MSDHDLGWEWFEPKMPSGDREKPHLDHDLAQRFARCFRSEDGMIVLEHLRSITHSRVLGPAASDALLRHMEGQRCLVAQIISLVEQGRGPSPAVFHDPARNASAIMENTDD